jgi:putative spermidine/putrescine transport system permease protein
MITAVAEGDGEIAARARPRFRGASPSRPEWWLATPLGLTYLAFFLAPLLLLLWISFHDDNELTRVGTANWVKFLGDPFYVGVVLKTLKLGLLTVLATTVLSYPVAIIYYETTDRLRRVLLFIIILPLLLSVVVRTFAWIAILSREGVANSALQALGLTDGPIPLLQTEFGLIFALMQIEMPLMLLPLIAVMQRIDPRLIEASRALGASRWRTTFRVLIPLSLPGWVAGSTLVFASSTTAFISQSVIGGDRLVYLPKVIWQQAMVIYNWPLAAVASVMLLVSVLGGIFVIGMIGRRISREAL